MKILRSWLREFVDVPDTADAIAVRMGVRGFAVEGIDPAGDDDAIIDFEITANRPDCMSVIGMAREVATTYGVALREAGAGDRGPGMTRTASPGPRTGSASDQSPSADPASPIPDPPALEILLDNPDLCPRYVGVVADVTVAPSPEWMQARLRAAGIRPISNIVDITNYVLVELGQPMHAFDYARVGQVQIRVRTARAGETLRTLDGQTRELSPDMLVIADGERPMAVAGVMGGAESEVTSATRTIVFESAYFNPLSIRRTSKKLGLKTEASMRFERGADPQLADAALARACALLEQIGAGRARSAVIDRYPAPIDVSVLRLRRTKLDGLLGIAVPDADVRRILDSLGFTLADAGDGWNVTVPTRRVDVVREVDLIEEVARHYGFDRIPVTFPAVIAAPPRQDPRTARARHLRAVMTGAGFSEAMTFGFIGESVAAPFATAGDLVPIANPLSENFAVLRPSVVPGLVDAVARNRRREQRDVRLFEIGARFSRSAGERRAIACVWTGMVGDDHWSGGTRDVDFFDLKGTIERIGLALGFTAQVESHQEPWLVPGRTAAIVANGARLGVFGQLTPALADKHGLPSGDAVYVAEIDLDATERLTGGSIRVEPLPRYPSVTRDISIVVDSALASEQVRRTVREAAPATLVRVREFDRYQGKGVPDGKVSLSLRLTFRSPEGTLTDADVQTAMDTVLLALKTQHEAVQR